MPWPCTFQYILGRVDITIFNVATVRTDMGTDGKRLLDPLTTPIAFLRGVAGVHSNDLMSSTFSLGSENIEERAPGGVHDALCEMVIFHHPINVQVFNGNMVILFSVLFSDLEMKITALPFDLQMGLRRALRSFSTPLRAFPAACNRALLASQGSLTLAIVSRVLYRLSFRVRQEGLKTDINADIRMLTRGRQMLILGFSLADDESIPMPIRTQDKMCCPGRSFNRTMQLDLDGATQLLGDRQMLATIGKREIGLVLSQLNGMPSIRFLETGETSLLTQFAHGKEAFEGLIQTISQHLDRGSRHMLTPTTTERCSQVIFQEEFACLLIVLFGGGQHLVVEMSRLDQAPHECFGLGFIRKEAIFKRSHAMYFTASKLNCQKRAGPSRSASEAPTPFSSPCEDAQGLSRADIGKGFH